MVSCMSRHRFTFKVTALRALLSHGLGFAVGNVTWAPSERRSARLNRGTVTSLRGHAALWTPAFHPDLAFTLYWVLSTKNINLRKVVKAPVVSQRPGECPGWTKGMLDRSDVASCGFHFPAMGCSVITHGYHSPHHLKSNNSNLAFVWTFALIVCFC